MATPMPCSTKNKCTSLSREETIAAGAVLVTNNVREFEHVPGLVLEEWAN